MKWIGFICAFVAAVALLPSEARAEDTDEASCAVYRTFLDLLPGNTEQHVVHAETSPQLRPNPYGREEDAPIVFRPDRPLRPPPPLDTPSPEPVTVDTSSYYRDTQRQPDIRISNCFAERGTRIFEGTTSNEFHEFVVNAPDDFLALWMFSRVAFSQDGRHALMVGGFVCGPLCGGGAYYLFERTGAEWTLVGSKRLWVS
jgi:hypothetical protein